MEHASPPVPFRAMLMANIVTDDPGYLSSWEKPTATVSLSTHSTRFWISLITRVRRNFLTRWMAMSFRWGRLSAGTETARVQSWCLSGSGLMWSGKRSHVSRQWLSEYDCFPAWTQGIRWELNETGIISCLKEIDIIFCWVMTILHIFQSLWLFMLQGKPFAVH